MSGASLQISVHSIVLQEKHEMDLPHHYRMPERESCVWFVSSGGWQEFLDKKERDVNHASGRELVSVAKVSVLAVVIATERALKEWFSLQEPDRLRENHLFWQIVSTCALLYCRISGNFNGELPAIHHTTLCNYIWPRGGLSRFYLATALFSWKMQWKFFCSWINAKLGNVFSFYRLTPKIVHPILWGRRPVLFHKESLYYAEKAFPTKTHPWLWNMATVASSLYSVI